MYEVGSNARPDRSLAVVVGAGGMGIAIARRLGQSHRLLLVSRSQATLDKQAAALHTEGHDVITCACDVTDAQDIARVAEVVANQGPMRTLAHVVGISPSMGDFRTIMAVDLRGPAMMAEALLPFARTGSAAIFVSSLAAYMQQDGRDSQILDHTFYPAMRIAETYPYAVPRGVTDGTLWPLLDAPLADGFLDSLEATLGGELTSHLAYRLSKAGLNRMCVRLAPIWGRQGARIMSMSPGMIATPMGALEYKHQPMKYEYLRRTPLSREGTMLEMADVVEFLASDRASFITGIDLLVDGGLTAALRR
jgi:NAD(P)-dependent dehydrogenase (short-subunit alcohol dehydrogenase family)